MNLGGSSNHRVIIAAEKSANQGEPRVLIASDKRAHHLHQLRTFNFELNDWAQRSQE